MAGACRFAVAQRSSDDAQRNQASDETASDTAQRSGVAGMIAGCIDARRAQVFPLISCACRADTGEWRGVGERSETVQVRHGRFVASFDADISVSGPRHLRVVSSSHLWCTTLSPSVGPLLLAVSHAMPYGGSVSFEEEGGGGGGGE